MRLSMIMKVFACSVMVTLVCLALDKVSTVQICFPGT